MQSWVPSSEHKFQVFFVGGHIDELPDILRSGVLSLSNLVPESVLEFPYNLTLNPGNI